VTLTSTDAMTPEHLEECLTILTAGAPRTGLAHEQGPVLRSAGRLIGMSARTVQGWLRGEAPVPEDVAAWLRRRAAARRANPPPHLPETPAQQRGRTEEAKEEARELGRRLAAALKVLGWTQPSLAHAVGRSVQTANYWITGKIPPPLVVVEWAERLAADDAADPSPRAKVGSVPLTEVMEGIDLLRKAGLTKVAALLERQMDGAAAEAEEVAAAPAPAPAKNSAAPEKKVPTAPMTQDEAWACLGVLGWKARDPARLIGFDTRNGRRWFSGDDTMPPAMAAWLRKLVAVHRAATQGLPKNTPEEGRVAVGAKAVAAAMGDLARLAEEVRAWEHVQVERKLAARAAAPAVSEDASGLAGLLGEDQPAVRGGR
jgi:transcriptional regulator with XRE-family HTH domain